MQFICSLNPHQYTILILLIFYQWRESLSLALKFSVLIYCSRIESDQCPLSCECYESKKGSINIACGNIEGSSLSDLSETIHVLTFSNITFDDRVIFGPSLNFIPFNHLVIESCGGSTQATSNRRDRLIADNDTYSDIPDHKSLSITNSRHIFEWKWTSFNFKQILIENSTLFAFHLPILTRKFVSKVIGPNVTSLSLNGCKITSIQSGALSDLGYLRYLEITRNEELSRIPRDALPEQMKQLWYLDLSDNSLEYIELKMFQGMPSLTEVNLSGNKLISLDYEIYRNIWPQLLYFNVKGNQLSCQNLCWSLELGKLHYPFAYEDTVCDLNNGNLTKLFNYGEQQYFCNDDKLIDLIATTTANLRIIA
ncbi:uncharacterized protein LOC107370291 [Tetranychus urticae]|uniref:uncharacterized protein LOC107370291 n=1 Tax=Tetranychus urticae TaxID=32264 RepID=UPI000D647F18|nr:uncharacterized protein LOC107370291 [Tetranychus urticae]